MSTYQCLKPVILAIVAVSVLSGYAYADSNECTDDDGKGCVGCLGRDGLCHPKKSYDNCIASNAKWCPATTTCSFSNGEVRNKAGKPEKELVKTDTEDECAKLVKKEWPQATGATWTKIGETWEKYCYAEFGDKIVADPGYRACLFDGDDEHDHDDDEHQNHDDHGQDEGHDHHNTHGDEEHDHDDDKHQDHDDHGQDEGHDHDNAHGDEEHDHDDDEHQDHDDHGQDEGHDHDNAHGLHARYICNVNEFKCKDGKNVKKNGKQMTDCDIDDGECDCDDCIDEGGWH